MPLTAVPVSIGPPDHSPGNDSFSEPPLAKDGVVKLFDLTRLLAINRVLVLGIWITSCIGLLLFVIAASTAASNYGTSPMGLPVALWMCFGIPHVLVCLIWSLQAHSNLKELGATGLSYGPLAAAICPLIPLINFVIPIKATSELIRASSHPESWRDHRTSSQAGIWAMLWFLLQVLVHLWMIMPAGPGPATQLTSISLTLYMIFAHPMFCYYSTNLMVQVWRDQQAAKEGLAMECQSPYPRIPK